MQNPTILQFARFCLNYPHDFIHKAFSNNPAKDGDPSYLVIHLTDVFDRCYRLYGSNAVMVMFYVRLSEVNQQTLNQYIYKLYNN